MHFLFSHSCPLLLGCCLDIGYNSAGTQKLGELRSGSGMYHYIEEILFILCVVISVALTL